MVADPDAEAAMVAGGEAGDGGECFVVAAD
jgi:hypothetical protein